MSASAKGRSAICIAEGKILDDRAPTTVGRSFSHTGRGTDDYGIASPTRKLTKNVLPLPAVWNGTLLPLRRRLPALTEAGLVKETPRRFKSYRRGPAAYQLCGEKNCACKILSCRCRV